MNDLEQKYNKQDGPAIQLYKTSGYVCKRAILICEMPEELRLAVDELKEGFFVGF